MTILTYIDLRNTWQTDAMRDSQELQDTQFQTSNEQSRILQQQTNEEALVQMELDGSEEVSTELYTRALQKFSEIATKYETKLQALMAQTEAKERLIQQRITAREPKIKAVDADIESLNETLTQRTEEQFSTLNNM